MMRSVARSICLLLSCLALAGCGAHRHAGPQGTSAPIATKETAPPQAKLAVPPDAPLTVESFPADVGGFTRGTPTQFPQPGLGFSVPYYDPRGITVSLYVYDAGMAGIADGLSDQAQEQLREAILGIEEAERRGIYHDVARRGDRPLSLGRLALAGAEFSAVTVRGDAISLVFVTGYRKNFFKLRITYPAAGQAECEAALGRFFAALQPVLGL